MSRRQILSELLNNRQNELSTELLLMYDAHKLAGTLGKTNGIEVELNTIANTLQNNLTKKLGIELEDVAEDEDVEVDEVDFEMIGGAIELALNKARAEMKSYNQFDTHLEVLGLLVLLMKNWKSYKKLKKDLKKSYLYYMILLRTI